MKIKVKKKDVVINSSKDLYSVMRKILLRESKLRRKQEYLWVAGISLSSRLQFVELVALGRQNGVTADPIDVFGHAMHKRCKSIIIIHNHPNGSVIPSKEDILFTQRMTKVGKTLGIEVLDHLVITEKDYFSVIEHDIV